jgi:hypothetical protein
MADRSFLEWLIASAVLGDVCDEEDDGTEEQLARYERAVRWEQRAYEWRGWGAWIAWERNESAPVVKAPGRPGRGTNPALSSIASERGT